MSDYTKTSGFWKRLESFVEDIQTNCCAGEEEKEMILHVCKQKHVEITAATIADIATVQKEEHHETECVLCGQKFFTFKTLQNICGVCDKYARRL